MDSAMVFLTMLGVVFGAAVIFFIYNVFIKDALLKGKSIAGKAESILKKRKDEDIDKERKKLKL